jgi:hypothetical protein
VLPNRRTSMADRKQAEQLAYVMQFLYSLGFDLDTVKRAADAWWQIKGAPVSGVEASDKGVTEGRDG